MIPSPQMVEHLSLVTGNSYPPHEQFWEQVSILHADEQPSWFIVLLSSHSSTETLNPSPHNVLHELFINGKCQPEQEQFSAHVYTLHMEEQPSLLIVLLSSHSSVPTLNPSPHNVVQVPLTLGR